MQTCHKNLKLCITVLAARYGSKCSNREVLDPDQYEKGWLLSKLQNFVIFIVKQLSRNMETLMNMKQAKHNGIRDRLNGMSVSKPTIFANRIEK